MRRTAASVVVVALAIVGVGCSGSTGDDSSGAIVGADSVTGTVDTPPAITPTVAATVPQVPADGEQPEGFSAITARITEPDGEVCEVCVWLADAPDERARGLMGVTDLGDAAGMAFVFDEASVGAFYMFQTPTPLSIAWFAPDGGYVGSADMAPCLDAPSDECARYSPDEAYDLAIEVFDDGSGDPLAERGLVPGSSVELVAGTEADTCPDVP